MQRWFLPFLSTLLLLQGCVAAALVGTAAVGTKVSVDPEVRERRLMMKFWKQGSVVRCRRTHNSGRMRESLSQHTRELYC